MKWYPGHLKQDSPVSAHIFEYICFIVPELFPQTAAFDRPAGLCCERQDSVFPEKLFPAPPAGSRWTWSVPVCDRTDELPSEIHSI